MEYLNYEFHVPYLDITVNKDTILEYGKTHAASAAPLAVFVFLILFGVMMTLVWIYIVLRKLCACCCGGKKRPVSIPAEGLNSPMARTGAPLLDSPKGATNPMQASASVDSRYNHMLSTQAWQANRRVYRWRYFYSCSLILILALLGCALAIFLNQTKFDQTTGVIIHDVKGLFVDTADFVCTADGTHQCEPKSVGKFIQRIRNKLINTAGSLTTFLHGVSDILPYTNTTINELETADTTLNAVINQMDFVSSNITEINKYKAWLTTPSNTGGFDFSSNFPTAAISKPSTSSLTKASQAISTSIQNTKGVYTSVSNTVTTTLGPAIDSMNVSKPDSMVKNVVDQVDSILDKFYSVDTLILKFYKLMRDNTDKYDGYLPNKTQGVSGLFALPALFFIIFTVINYYCSKGSVHLCCNMCVAYICLILFALVAFLVSTIAVITNTACEYRGTFIDMAPTKTFQLPGNTTMVLGPKLINDVLHCPGGINATDDNNFVDILGVGKLFNITDKVNSGLSQVTDAKASFDPGTTIRAAIKQLKSINNITNTNVTKSVPIDTYLTQLDSFISSLPSENMDRTDSSERTKLNTMYDLDSKVTNTNGFWTDFQTYINNVNTVLAAASLQTGTVIPNGGITTYTYATIGSLVDYGVSGANSDFNPSSASNTVNYDSNSPYTDLTAAIANLTSFETAADAAIAVNDQMVANLTIVEARANDIKTSINIMTDLQASVVATTDSINGTLWDILVKANDIRDGLDVQVENIKKVAAFANTADEFTLCGFIGDFYVDTVEGQICGDFQTTLNGTWPAMLLAILILFLAFVTNSCYVRKPRWYLEPEEPPGLELSEAPFTTRPLSTGREVVLT